MKQEFFVIVHFICWYHEEAHAVVISVYLYAFTHMKSIHGTDHILHQI